VKGLQKYVAEATKSSPYMELNYEDRKLIFEGQSYPENAYSLYEPVYKWVEEYIANIGENETTVEFSLSYVNTSSTKCFIILLDKLNKAYLQGKKVVINWHYDEENGFDFEMGQDFKEDIEIPFNFIPIENKD
jgi:hypothetical protein